MLVLDGLAVAKTQRELIKKRVDAYKAKHNESPGLSVVLVGDDPGSQVYVKNKSKACDEVGIRSELYALAASVGFEEIQKLITKLNNDPKVNGILLQLPLPKSFDSEKIIDLIDPKKDADGITTENMGRLWKGQRAIKPCTPFGVMAILEHYKISLVGKNAVVIGRSQIVGKPMAQLLIDAQATVTICHTKTSELIEHTRRADVVVVAMGKPRMLGKEAFKKDAVVIDVGMHRLDDGKLCGDVRFEELDGAVMAATPVPKGVGPMTITMLLENTVQLAELQKKG